MNIVKKYLISLGISMGFILILVFFLNILNYFDVLSNSIYKGFLVLFSMFSVVVGSYILGTKTDNKGYLNGLVYGLVIVILFIIISLFDGHDLNLSSFIYYLIIVITSTIGGSVGINKKPE